MHGEMRLRFGLQQIFYQDLFSSKNTIDLQNSTFSPLLYNLPCLTEALSQNLEKPFSLAELEDSIKRSKLNKAPGPDGYTNEFLIFLRRNSKPGCLELTKKLIKWAPLVI